MSGQQVSASGPLNATRRAEAFMAALGVRTPGALLQTGMGLFTYPELADRLDDVVAVIMKGQS